MKGEEKRKTRKKKEDQAAPPGYIQSLVNKIISNIQIVCNNLILKYVEDDLVLSLNVRTVSYVSCNESWQPSFTELSLPDLMLRKLLSVSDLTICLDRRGTTGKIEVYQDPLLYRCSMSVRLCWCYQAVSAKVPFKTIINLLADKMEFSMTGLQVPMVVRLFKLFLAFYYGDIITKHELERRRSKVAEQQEGEEGEGAGHEEEAGLGSYLWDVGSTIGTALLPVYWEDEDNPAPAPPPPSTLASVLAVYIKEASLTLKLAANVKQKGFYRGGKQCFTSYLVCKLAGLFSEVATVGAAWVNVRAGVSQLQVTPVGGPAETIGHYILAGAESDRFLEKSLFVEAEEGSQEEWRASEEPDWDRHLDTVTETAMVDRSPALALDYVYTIELGGDEAGELGSEKLAEILGDLEHSDLPERALCRAVLGPAQLTLTQGAVKRLRTVRELITEYDYVPYVEAAPPPGPDSLQLPSKEEVARLEAGRCVRVYRVSVLAPSLALHTDQARLQLGARALELGHEVPMYPLRSVRAACVMHPPSSALLRNCHSSFSFKLTDGWANLNTGAHSTSTRIVSIDKAVFNTNILMYENFWKNLYQKFGDATFQFDTLQVDFSMPQIAIMLELLSTINNTIMATEALSEVHDKFKMTFQPVLSTVINGISFGLSWTKEIYTVTLSLDGAGASLKGEAGVKAIPIFTGLCRKTPRPATLSSAGQSPGKAAPDVAASKYLAATVQLPCGALPHPVPTLIHLDMGQSFLLLDPKLTDILKFSLHYHEAFCKSTKTYEAGSRSIKSEDQDAKMSTSGPPDSQISVLQSLTGAIVDVKIGETAVYLSDKTLTGGGGVSGQTVPEVAQRAARARREHHLVTVRLAGAAASNANTRVELGPLLGQHPVLFPPAVWTAGKVNFPWHAALTGFSVATMAESHLAEILLPVNTSCTFGSSANDVTRSLAIHVDMSALQFLVTTAAVTSLALLAQTLLAMALDTPPAARCAWCRAPRRSTSSSAASAPSPRPPPPRRPPC